jgi:hypothetical protein
MHADERACAVTSVCQTRDGEFERLGVAPVNIPHVERIALAGVEPAKRGEASDNSSTS